jgi:hypothetical protein
VDLEERLIAPCGMNCGVCSRYLASKHDLKSRGIMKTSCAGCLPQGRGCHYKRQCDRLGKGLVRFCYECAEFPCRRLKTLDKRYRTFYHKSMIENLEYIRDSGIQDFLTREAAKWRCPDCGGVICCHNGVCFSCGPEKLRGRKTVYRWEG